MSRKRKELLEERFLIPSPGPILCWIISWNFPDSKNPAEVLDNRIKEEMEEEIVCNRWKDLADHLLVLSICGPLP